MSNTITAATTGAANNVTTPAPKTSGVNDLADRNTFLKLLVAQIKNQDPLNPTDGIQFVTQLAQFGSLEQNVQMGQDMAAIRDLLNQRLPPAAADPTVQS
jgi:flagellar basal-body rod modification protein FlgD